MKNKIVDSHCHLDFEDFKNDLDKIIDNARKNDVEHLLSISVDLESFIEIHKISQKYKNVWCTTGVHPNNVPKTFEKNQIETLKKRLHENLSRSKVIGIGETGLDFYRGLDNAKNQISYFEAHIQVAAENNAPIIVHTRDADNEIIKNLKKLVDIYKCSGLIHCFSSGKDLAKCALDIGFYISFSGIITFKKSYELREVVDYVPMDRILIETDSPYLAPVPFRGKRNEPAYTKYTLEQVALVKGISEEKVAEITTKNFFQLFKKANNEI